MKKYLYHSNRLPIQTLGWLTPVEKRKDVDPKILNFKKVYMITHRRSGLLISKFTL